MSEYKVPVQSLIDHIKTAADVDPWTKEMAERLLKDQEPKPVLSDRQCENGRTGFCPKCHQVVLWMTNREYCGFCGQGLMWE